MIPYDKRDGKIWYNGDLVEWQDAKLHVISHGLHYASLVFEGVRVYDGEIFKLQEHTDRLYHSAKRMDMNIPYTKEEINKACNQIIKIQNVQNGYLRPFAWRGSEMMGVSAQKTKINVAVATWEGGDYFDPKLKIEGIKNKRILEVLSDPIVNDSCIVSGYRLKRIAKYDRYYHILDTDYFSRENENSDWIHYKNTTTEYDYSHPFKGIE